MSSVRRAVPEDAAAIARIHVDTWRANYADIMPEEYLASLNYTEKERDWAEAIAKPTTLMIVAEHNGEVIGFSGGGKRRVLQFADDTAGELYTLYIKTGLQKQGAGKMLVQEVANQLQALGFSRMLIAALKVNTACIFYEKLGGKQLKYRDVEIGGRQFEQVCYEYPLPLTL